jgi:hypothetical protein
MEGLLGLVIIAIIAAFYFIPTIVAASSNKRNTGAIFVLNLFLGWTFLGWVAALVWAVADERSALPQTEPLSPRAPSAASVPDVSPRATPATWKAMPAPVYSYPQSSESSLNGRQGRLRKSPQEPTSP